MRVFALRKPSLSFDQHASIGDRSGEYGGQVHDLCPTSSNRFDNAADFMSPQIVHHHDVTWPQRRSQNLFDVSEKHLTRRGAGNRHQGLEARKRKRPDQGDVNPGGLGTQSRTRSPLGARPCVRVIDKLMPDSSTNVKRSEGIERISVW